MLVKMLTTEVNQSRNPGPAFATSHGSGKEEKIPRQEKER